jgi:uncharacterized protein (TIGR03118 family)
MRNWFRTVRGARTAAPAARRSSRRPGLESLEDRSLMSAGFLQTNLVSDQPNQTSFTNPPDSNLINPWGLAYSPTGVFWVADNHSGSATLYNSSGTAIPLVVNIPPASGSAAGTLGSPTGTVFNYSGSGFDVMVNGTPMPSSFLWATLDGTIAGWAGGPNGSGSNAGTIASHPKTATFSGAVYTGLALDTDGIGRNLLYAADSAHDTIDVYSFNPGTTTTPPTTSMTSVPGGFSDPASKGYTVFDIQNLGGLLYVTYTKDKGNGGLVDVFNSDGVLQEHLIQNNGLNEPWGIALAPSNFGAFSNDLIVGNNDDTGFIHAYNPHTGQLVGTMTNGQGKPLAIPDLWALKFGNGGGAGPTNTLFFTTGVDPATENHGLFGSIQAIPSLKNANAPIVSNLTNPPPQAFSTVPANGDVNPYGVAFVPNNVVTGGLLHGGDTLVANFNNNTNTQGTGTTIVDIGPNGQSSVFFQGQAGLGLDTALSVLRNGFVIVGNAPINGTTVKQGSLLIIDKTGTLKMTLTDANLLNGPWDMTVHDMGNTAVLFVSNVLSGGITRITLTFSATGPTVKSMVQIAHGYATRTDPAALVVGPTGLAYNAATDTLYVASTGDNKIFAIAHASTTTDKGMGRLVVQDQTNLHGPLGLVLAPNGNLIVANGDAQNPDANNPNLILEYTPQGKLVGTPFELEPASVGPGAAFGIAISSSNGEIRFAAVDDATNKLDIWTFV